MTFGDITLYPETGVLEAEAMTRGRIEGLIESLKQVCTDIPILEASRKMQPTYKNKPDQEAFEANSKLLQGGLDCQVQCTINKTANESMGIYCGYCGIEEED